MIKDPHSISGPEAITFIWTMSWSPVIEDLVKSSDVEKAVIVKKAYQNDENNKIIIA